MKRELETSIFFDNWTRGGQHQSWQSHRQREERKEVLLVTRMTKPANPTTEVRVEYLCGVDGRTKTVTLLGEDVVAVEPSRH